MRNSYLKPENSLINADTYSSTRTYAIHDEVQQVLSSYSMLPEEYDIFSDIDNSYFLLEDTKQHRLLSSCLKYLRDQLFRLYVQYGAVRILPKLKMLLDSDGAIVLNWAYATFRIYFSFESSIDNSFFGMVAQQTEDTMFTSTGKLNEMNYQDAINKALEYAISNS